MQKDKLTLGVALIIAVIAVGWGPLASAEKAFVEATGQTTSYAPGDDGNLQAGVRFPTPRFKDNANGTVTDRLTGLVWLQRTDCFQLQLWTNAVHLANTLASGLCGLTDGSVMGDWHLPNVKELLSLIDYGFFFPALSNTEGTGQWTEGDAFIGVKSGKYWSSSTIEGTPTRAWAVNFASGAAIDDGKDEFGANPVLPVRNER